MKVALVRYRYSPHGGAERYLDGLSAELSKGGAEVRIVCSSWDGGNAGRAEVERVAMPGRPAPLRLLLFARAVRDWVRRNPGWLLFSLDRVPGAEVYRAGDGVHAEWLFRKRALRSGSWPLDYLRPLNRAYLHLERAMFASPYLRSVIANSNQGRDEIVRHYGVPSGKIAVVYNGVDLSRYDPGRKREAAPALRRKLGIPEEEAIFLFVGSGFARKGVATLAKATVRLAARRARFRVVVVGKGDPRPHLAEAERGGAGGRILFTGPTAGAEDFLHGADAFVFPAIYEPFSNACLEAMAAGLPVVTTGANGASEILRDGDSGFVLGDPFDAEGFADRMERLLSPDLRRWMGERARGTAEEHPVERNGAETLEVLERAWRAKGGS